MPFSCQIITPEDTVFKGDVISINAPGLLGRFQTFKNHAPITYALTKGVLNIDLGTEKKSFEIDSGIFEITTEHQAIILADRAVAVS